MTREPTTPVERRVTAYVIFACLTAILSESEDNDEVTIIAGVEKMLKELHVVWPAHQRYKLASAIIASAQTLPIVS